MPLKIRRNLGICVVTVIMIIFSSCASNNQAISHVGKKRSKLKQAQQYFKPGLFDRSKNKPKILLLAHPFHCPHFATYKITRRPSKKEYGKRYARRQNRKMKK